MATVVSNCNVDNIINMRFIGIASGSTVANSTPDGFTWTARTLSATSNWSCAAFGNEMCVAVSSTSGTVAALTSDGTTWYAKTMPATATWYGVAYGKGMFSAVSGGSSTVAASSYDGTNWQKNILPTAGDWRCIAFGDFANANSSSTSSKSFSVSSISNLSDNSSSSSSSSSSNHESFSSHSSASLQSLSSKSTSSSYGSYSSNSSSKSWSLSSVSESFSSLSSFSNSSDTSSTRSSDSTSMSITSKDSNSSGSSATTSSSGSTQLSVSSFSQSLSSQSLSMSSISLSMSSLSFSMSSETSSSKVFSQSSQSTSSDVATMMFVTLSYGTNKAAYSYNGTSWHLANNLPTTANWTSVAFDGSLGMFVGVATGSAATVYSYDGITWFAGSMPLVSNWSKITSNDLGLFVAVSATTGTIAATSADGINWALQTMPLNTSWVAVAYAPFGGGVFSDNGGGLFVALSSGSTTAASSPDGIVWSPRTQVSSTWTHCCYAPFKWRSGDALTIDNGATVTVNTDQKKFWSSIPITNGKLMVENRSNTQAIRFTTGRTNGGNVQGITPASGLGSIEFEGAWIQIGTGDGSAGQTLATPYTDYVPALWVETDVGTGIYEIWLNVTGVYGPSMPKWVEGLASVATGSRGKFFVQNPNPSQDVVLFLNNSITTTGSRILKVSSTAGIFVGATVTGGTIPANAVIEKIVDATTLEMNAIPTANQSNITVVIYNPFSQQLLNTVTFGNGVNGNRLTSGVRVKIPNIMGASDTSAKIQTLNATLGMSIVMTNGGSVSLKTCLFDEAYHNFTQSQSCIIQNVGQGLSPVLAEIYNLHIDGYGLALSPVRRYYLVGWYQRDVRDLNTGGGGGRVAPNYINDATINNLVTVMNETFTGSNNTSSGGSVAAPIGAFQIQYSDRVTLTNSRFYQLQKWSQGRWGISINVAVNDSLFQNIEIYGMMPVDIAKSARNTFKNIIWASSMQDVIQGYTAGARYNYDPVNDIEFNPGQKYYFKERSYYTRDRLTYSESQEFSATPFVGDTYFPDYFTCYCNAHTSVSLGWTNRTPVHNNPSYEIYRSRESGFIPSPSNRIFSTNTAATTTFVNAGNKPTMTAGGRTLTFNAAKTITASTGSFITDGYIVGDQLLVTGTVLNNGWYTIANVAALILTVNEGLITESAYSATAILTTNHMTNHPNITATAGRTLTFNAAKTITAGGASPGSFTLVDGYSVGDIIEVSGCTNPINNGIKTIGTLTATVITTLESLVTESTYTATATIKGRPLLNNTTYYYILRKYDGIDTFHDSAEQEVYVHNPNIDIVTNRLLQNDVFDNASWLKSSYMTVTASIDFSPICSPNTATNALTADRLAAVEDNQFVYQAISTAVGNYYNFSVYICTRATEIMNNVAGYISMGPSLTSQTAITNFIATSTWQRISVTYKATTVSTTAIINVNLNGNNILVSGAMLNDGAVAYPPITTTTAVVTNTNMSRFPILMRPWCRSLAGETHHSGIEVNLHGTGPTGYLFGEVYCSPTKGFTPSVANRINIINVSGSQAIIGLDSNCIYNVFDNIIQVGLALDSNNQTLFTLATYCNNNIFKNMEINTCFGYYSSVFNIATGCNDNTFSNISIRHWRNYTGQNLLVNNNNAPTRSIFQNIRMGVGPGTGTSDFYINNQYLGTIMKGISGGNATPPNNATLLNGRMVWPLGSTTDGINVLNQAIYDNMFYELYFTPQTTGALHLQFNDSTALIKPFTLIGSAKFSNTGKLFMPNPGDGIEIVWPHNILGVTGFRELTPKYYGVDLGTSQSTALDVLEGLYVEYSIKIGINGSWSTYEELTGSNLVNESVSATTGFYFKVRLTAKLGMKYGVRSNQFLVGEVIEGFSSGAYATVDKVFDNARDGLLTGTLWLSNVHGTFTPNEVIREKTEKLLRATNVTTNTNFALFPSFTSYISALQLYTNINTSVLYPSSFASLTLQNVVQNSNYYIFRTSSGAFVASGTQTDGTNIVIPNIGYDGDEYFTVRVRLSSPAYTKYLPFETQALWGINGVSVYVAQVLDTINA